MKARTHVLFCVPNPALGGAAMHALDLLVRLDPTAFDVSLLVRERQPLPAQVEARASRICCARDYYEMADAIRAIRPDVIQHYNSLAILAGIELAGPRPFSVQILHANHALEPDYQALPTDETDVLVAVSDSAARLYPNAQRDEAKLRVVWSGVDVEVLRPRLEERGSSHPVRLLCVARLEDATKRLSDVLDACAALRQGSFTLTIAGDGPDRAALERAAMARGLAEVVHFAGFVPDRRQIYGAADILVSASPSEGFGLAIAEAAACGLTIVARRCHGVTEAMTHQEHALLAGSPSELFAHLALALERPDLRRRLGQSARALMEQRFDVRRMTAEYEALYLGSAARSPS